MKPFIARRAIKKYPETGLPADDAAALPTAVALAVRDDVPELIATGDDELTFATVLAALLRQQREKARRHVAAGASISFERWAAVHRFVPAARQAVEGWVSFHAPHNVDHDDLVPLRRPDEKLPNVTDGPLEHRRRRDGFGLTDPRMSRGRSPTSPTTACTATSGRRTPARRGCTTSTAR